MKKFFMIAAMAVATLTANAQYRAGTWSIQPKVGVTITSVTNLNNNIGPIIGAGRAESQTYVGATIGGEVEYQIDKQFSVAAGIGYIMQGKQWDDYVNATGKAKDLKLELGYVNVPIVLNYQIFKGFAVKAGMQFAFLTNAKMKATEETTGRTESYSEDVKSQMSSFDFSIPVGASYEFSNHIIIDARYNIGVTKVNKESVAGYSDCHNSVLLATVGYKFKM